MGRVQDKVVIVTGAGGGLGEASARLLAREGGKVILTDIDEGRGAQVARDIGEPALFLKRDVRDEAGWESLVDEVCGRFGKLDLLVNNAGVTRMGFPDDTYVDGPRLTIDLAEYDRSLAFICPASKVQPQMTAGQDGFRHMSSKQVSGM
ncbi:SDR family NAD(P)-dependent oxidoreductase [Sphingobium sp. 15-1]|uniref:SDR family NAD(P)-dependent oxidoreductase n=2 Tax=Sphingobium TaxID=165695 RepID=UPI00159C0C62|nr:SDR family NAD(P)-dependent oxidoreductase [Sphingobium sp. 15-1]